MGLTVAIPLLLLAMSGTLLLFRDVLFVPAELRKTRSADSPSNDQIGQLLRGLSGSDWTVVLLPSQGRAFYAIEYGDGRRRYVAANTLQALDPPPSSLQAENLLYRLHTMFLLGEPGMTVVKIVGPLSVVLLVVGLVMWWPGSRRWRWQDLRLSGTTRLQLIGFHRSFALATVALFGCSVVSGTLLAHRLQLREWLQLVARPTPSVSQPSAQRRFESGDYSSAISSGRAVFPAGQLTQIVNAGDGQLRLKVRFPGERHPYGRSTVTVDVSAGRIVSARDTRTGGWLTVWDDLLYPFHTGSLWGCFQQSLWFMGGLCLLTAAGTALTSVARRLR
jgi:uncharacterized iron-regulated membrane protein